MKGSNTLELNEATLIEAVQLLLDRDAPGAGVVKSVKPGQQSNYSQTFAVSVEKPEPGPT